MSIRRDLFVALLGGLVITTAVAGLVIIESREGPRDHEVAPVAHPVQVQGQYEATPAQGEAGPGDVCVPQLPQTECTPARTRLDLRVEGLPALPEGLHYTVFLVGGDDPWSLGPLAWQEADHVLAVDEARDASSHARMVIALQDTARPESPGGLVLYERTVGPEPSGTLDLDEETTMGLQEGTGDLRTSQTGAVTVSALVQAELEGLPAAPDWSHRAWFVDHRGELPVYTYLDDFSLDPDGGEATLDVRLERVRIEAQTGFLVTLETGPGSRGEPVGYPAYASTIR